MLFNMNLLLYRPRTSCQHSEDILRLIVYQTQQQYAAQSDRPEIFFNFLFLSLRILIFSEIFFLEIIDTSHQIIPYHYKMNQIKSNQIKSNQIKSKQSIAKQGKTNEGKARQIKSQEYQH